MDSIPFLNGIKRIHFIGIGGAGMHPIVQILHSLGYSITGSDVNEGSIIDAQRKMGISVMIPHSEENIKDAQLVVYTAALLFDNVELVAAREAGIKTVERSVMLGAVSGIFSNALCIAGTHGKTTVTAMVTQTLLMADIDTAAVIGGKLSYIDGYGKSGTCDTIVVEACEFANTFLQLCPSVAIILNVDKDHLDFFGSMQSLKNSFREFAAKATREIIINGDDDNSCEVCRGLGTKIITFGKKALNDFAALDIRLEENGFYSFCLCCGGKELGRIALAVPGEHNIYNALAAAAVGMGEGLAFEDIKKGIEAFKGASRRFEILGQCRNITVADDYAHHPAELTATLSAAKQLKFNRVVAIFQPFTYSRTKLLFDEFVTALSLPDVTIVTPIMAGREADPGDITALQLVEKIPGCIYAESFEDVVLKVKEVAREKDLIITLGCGDIYKAGKKLITEL